MGGALLWLFYGDLSGLKGTAERMVREQTGREFSIDGRFEPNIGMRTTLLVEKVRLGNAAWTEAASMIEAERLFIELDTQALLAGDLVFERLEIENAKIRLERDAEGRANWEFAPRAGRDAEGELPDWIVRQAEVTGFEFVYDGAPLERPLDVKASSLRLTEGDDERVKIVADGTINERAVEIDAWFSSWRDLVSGKNLRFQGDGLFGTFALSGTGLVDDVLAPREPEFKLRIEGPSFSDATQMFGLPDLGDGTLDLKAEIVSGDDDAGISVAGNIGEFTIDLAGRISELSANPDANLQVAFQGPHLDRIGRLLGYDMPPGEFAGVASITKTGNRYDASDVSLTVGDLQLRGRGFVSDLSADGDAELEASLLAPDLRQVGELFGVSELPADPVEAKAALTQTKGLVEIKDLRVVSGGAVLTGDGKLRNLPRIDDAAVKLRFTGQEFARFAPLLTPYAQLYGPYEITAEMDSNEKGVEVGRLVATFDVGTAELSGRLGEFPDWNGTRVNTRIRGDDSKALVATLGMTGLYSLPFDASGVIELTRDAVVISDIKADIADANVNGQLRIPRAQNDTRLDYDIDAQGPDLRAAIPTVPGYEPPAQPFDVQAQGYWEDDRVSFERLSVTVGEASLVISGDFDGAPDFRATGLSVDVRGPTLAEIGTFGGETLPDEPFELQARLKGTRDELIMREFNARLGRSDLTGNLRVDLADKPEVELTLISNTLDVVPFFDELDKEKDEEAPSPDAERVIPDITLSGERLKTFNANLVVDIGTLYRRYNTHDDVHASVIVRDGALMLEEFRMTEETGGVINASLRAAPQANGLAWSGRLNARETVFGVLAPADGDRANLPRYEVYADFTASGSNLRELAASMTGHVDVIGGRGIVDRTVAYRVFGDFFSQVANAINPFAKDENYAEIQCSAYLFNATDGVLTTDPAIVFQTDKLNILSAGSINLQDETLDLTFRTQARKGVGISPGDILNPYVKVAGTLQNPKLAMNYTGGLVAGGAAVVTGGLSILATLGWDRIFREKDPCREAIDQRREQRPAR